jgi:hypothetical protein
MTYLWRGDAAWVLGVGRACELWHLGPMQPAVQVGLFDHLTFQKSVSRAAAAPLIAPWCRSSHHRPARLGRYSYIYACTCNHCNLVLAMQLHTLGPGYAKPWSMLHSVLAAFYNQKVVTRLYGSLGSCGSLGGQRVPWCRECSRRTLGEFRHGSLGVSGSRRWSWVPPVVNGSPGALRVPPCLLHCRHHGSGDSRLSGPPRPHWPLVRCGLVRCGLCVPRRSSVLFLVVIMRLRLHRAGPCPVRWRILLSPHRHLDLFLFLRDGLGCLNNFSASISGASAGVRLPSGAAAS